MVKSKNQQLIYRIDYLGIYQFEVSSITLLLFITIFWSSKISSSKICEWLVKIGYETRCRFSFSNVIRKIFAFDSHTKIRLTSISLYFITIRIFCTVFLLTCFTFYSVNVYITVFVSSQFNHIILYKLTHLEA